MDFSLADEQILLQHEVAKALTRISPLNRVREAVAVPGEPAADLWTELRTLGLPGLLIDVEHGGLGRGLLDAALVAEQLGRCVVPAPFVAQVVMAPLAIAGAGSPEQKARLLPRLADGSLRIAVGISDFAAGTRAEAELAAEDGRLWGTSLFVLDSAGADMFLVADGEGKLHLVEAAAAGLQTTPLGTVDRTRAASRVTFDGTPAEPLACDHGRTLARMRDAGRVALAADTLGAASHMLDRAVQYAGQRRQFGRLIGSFQAVKHICADMAAELEPGRSLVWYAAYAGDEGLADAPLAAAHAKAHLSEVGRNVARRSIEVHGGIGITDELGLHYWFKRIGWNYQVLGSPERAREDAARLQHLVS